MVRFSELGLVFLRFGDLLWKQMVSDVYEGREREWSHYGEFYGFAGDEMSALRKQVPLVCSFVLPNKIKYNKKRCNPFTLSKSTK